MGEQKANKVRLLESEKWTSLDVPLYFELLASKELKSSGVSELPAHNAQSDKHTLQ